MNGLSLKAIVLSLAFLISLSSHALIKFEDAVFPELATSGRALAMGNAYVAKVDDSSAVFYNPAGLGTVRHPHLHLSNLHLEFNKDWMDLTTGGSATDASGNLFDGFSLDGLRSLLADNPGRIANSRFHFLPNFTARYFSMGYLVSRRTRATVGPNAGDQFEYADRTDHGPYVAMNISIFGGIFKVGASLTYLNRKEIFGESDPNVTIDSDALPYKKGSMALLTAGAKLTLPVVWLPTFAATIHNAASQDFSGRADGPPEKIKQTLHVGFSLTPQIGKVVRLHLEANYRDVGDSYSDVSSARKFTAGMEFDIARTFFIRFGYGDGFGSAGIGIKSRKLEFDLTTYAVDTTTSAWRGEEDRRFALSISSGF